MGVPNKSELDAVWRPYEKDDGPQGCEVAPRALFSDDLLRLGPSPQHSERKASAHCTCSLSCVLLLGLNRQYNLIDYFDST